jgi:hypothetical protein
MQSQISGVFPPPRPARRSAKPFVWWWVRPEVFRYVHGAFLALALFPQLAGWVAKLWWEAGNVPEVRFDAWQFFFAKMSSCSIQYFWPALCVSTLCAAVVLRQAPAAVVGACVLVASFFFLALGMGMVGYD